MVYSKFLFTLLVFLLSGWAIEAKSQSQSDSIVYVTTDTSWAAFKAAREEWRSLLRQPPIIVYDKKNKILSGTYVVVCKYSIEPDGKIRVLDIICDKVLEEEMRKDFNATVSRAKKMVAPHVNGVYKKNAFEVRYTFKIDKWETLTDISEAILY